MITKFENHITKSLRNYYIRKLRFPTIYLVFLVIISIIFPVRSLLFPVNIKNSKLEDAVKGGNIYFNTSLHNLYFTGYTRRVMGTIDGYYYYTMQNDKCLIVLLSPDSCDMGIPTIEKIRFSGKIVKNSTTLKTLYTNLSRDLSWNEAGVNEVFSPYVLSEPDGTGPVSYMLRYFIFISVIISAISILYDWVVIVFPQWSHPMRRLIVYGNPKKMLEEAEEELSTLPQLATDDMFITQHYFIETSKYGIAIVPIDKIQWIYKYSTLHKILWKTLKISYTLYITAEKNIYIKCPKNTKTDIDGIIDYLAEANHDILVGFDEKNRRSMEDLYNGPKALIKTRELLMKRI